jgi:oligo-1,6-glucosidase
MQWSAEAGAGFTQGKPWLGTNRNYIHINRAVQAGDPNSVLNCYKKLIALRAGSETLKYGSFEPLYNWGSLIAYRREREGESYTIALNFSKKPVKLRADMPEPLKALLQARGGDALVFTNAGDEGGGKTGAALPWEALIIRG